MGSDRARVSFDPSRRWRAVIAQQGRVTVEADWNEAQAIAAAQSRAQLLDVTGPSGTPDDGYRLLPPSSPPAASSPADLTIQHGTFYVGGVRVELDADTPIGAQPDWQDFPAEPAAADQPAPAAPPQTGNELVYLLLREQEVSAVEDSALREIALGGPDTGQRTRILQRVLRHRTTAGTWPDGWADAGQSWAASGYALDPATMRLESQARLQVSFTSVSPPSACQPDTLGGYLGAENQLIRVQICEVQGGNPVVVWGYDNASFLYRVATATPDSTSGTTTVTLASTPVDTYHQPQPGQVVEVLTAAVQLPASPSASPTPPPPDAIAASCGVVAALTADGGYHPGNGTVVLGTALTAPYGTADTPVLFLRVWQGQVTCTPGVPGRAGRHRLAGDADYRGRGGRRLPCRRSLDDRCAARRAGPGLPGPAADAAATRRAAAVGRSAWAGRLGQRHPYRGGRRPPRVRHPGQPDQGQRLHRGRPVGRGRRRRPAGAGRLLRQPRPARSGCCPAPTSCPRR